VKALDKEGLMFGSRKLRVLTMMAPILILAFGVGCKRCKKKPATTDQTGTVNVTPKATTPAAPANVPSATKDEQAPPIGSGSDG